MHRYMDEIIVNGDPFDGDENTSQEDKRVRALLSRSESKKREKPSEGFVVVSRSETTTTMLNAKAEPLLDITQGPLDPFTCYVQEILAKSIFRGSIPSEGPDRERDTPELYRDKQTFHRAVVGAKQFREETLGPLLEKMDAKLRDTLDEPLYEAIVSAPRLVARNQPDEKQASEWSGTLSGAVVRLEFAFPAPGKTCSLNVLPTEAEYIKALHNLFHLEKYIVAVLVDCLRSTATPIENYTQSWIVLATTDYAQKPIKQWEELTFIPFVDYMLGLWMTVRYFEGM